MIYNDPFLLCGWQPPFVQNKLVLSAANSTGYKALPLHLHEILFAAVFYEVLYRVSSVLSPRLCQSYRALTRRTQINFDIHIVSMIQALLILALSYPLFGDEVLAQSPNAYTPYSGFVCAMALGYFVWDSYVCLRYIKLFGPGFLVHGLAAGFVFMQALRPYALKWAPIFLFFEASTPFLNVHWFTSHLPAGLIPSWAELLNGVCLLFTFFSVRIVWGFYYAFRFAQEAFFHDTERIQPVWIPLTMLGSNLALDVLNVYWFSKMLKLATKKLKGTKHHHHSPKHVKHTQ